MTTQVHSSTIVVEDDAVVLDLTLPLVQRLSQAAQDALLQLAREGRRKEIESINVTS